MITKNFRHTASKRFSANLIVVSVVFTMGMMSGNVACGEIFAAAAWSGKRACELSLQLQNSPYREEYVAKLATETGNYWASNDSDQIMSDAQDDSDSLFSFFDKESSGNDQGISLDSFSKECLNCHDGLRAIDISVDYRNSPGGFRTGKHVSGKDHPIGMDYERYVAFDRGNYKPISMFNSKMHLIDGKVGCLTCHNPLNPEKNHLVMSDYGSALCLTCHNK